MSAPSQAGQRSVQVFEAQADRTSSERQESREEGKDLQLPGLLALLALHSFLYLALLARWLRPQGRCVAMRSELWIGARPMGGHISGGDAPKVVLHMRMQWMTCKLTTLIAER